MNETVYFLIGFVAALAILSFVVGLVALAKIESLKNKIRKLQEKLLDKDIDTTEIKI